MNKIVDFYSFSGTGNTQQIVEHAARSLENHGMQVSIKPLEKSFVPDDLCGEIWFAFPANSQSVSPFIWNFFQSLPKGNGERVFVLITLNDSIHILKPLYRLLKKKGYIPVSVCEVSMQNNFVNTDIDPVEDQQRLDAALKKVDEFIQSAVTGDSAWHNEYPGSKFVSFLTRETPLPWMTMRLMIKLQTNQSLCTQCCLCVEQCPVGNIKIEDVLPIHGNHCQLCMKCIAYCPHAAIQVLGKDHLRIRHA